MEPKPTSPNPVPLLTEAVLINETMRPATLPWHNQTQIRDVFAHSYPHQDALAEQVIEKVQQRIEALMPDLIKEAVDQVLAEHLASRSTAEKP